MIAAQHSIKTTREHASTKVLGYLRGLAIQGELKPGDRLPTERDLARTLRISRPSLREGIGHLTTFGVLRSVRGVGTFVAKDLQYGPLEEFCELYDFPAWNMFEARFAIEPQIASLAAERATKKQVRDLGRAVEGLTGCVDNPEEYESQDVLFHRMVAVASGNVVLSALIEAVTASTPGGDARFRAIGQPFDFCKSAELNCEIYRAIRSRSPINARLAMQRYLGHSHQALVSPIPGPLSEPAPALPDRHRGERFECDNPAPGIRPFAAWPPASSTAFGLRGGVPGIR
jgi:GntR family transcriptional repressor for pyruvate dehydrogenase complex